MGYDGCHVTHMGETWFMRHLPGLDLTMSVCLHGKEMVLIFSCRGVRGLGLFLIFSLLSLSLFLWCLADRAGKSCIGVDCFYWTGRTGLSSSLFFLLSVGNCVGVHSTHICLPRCCSLALGSGCEK